MLNVETLIYQDIYKLNNFLEDVDMYMTLDVGHSLINSFQENELYFDRVKHIHLSDNFKDKDSHLGLGNGAIDFKTVINLFEKNSYDGIYYVIEINDKNSIESSFELLKKLK